MPEFLSLRVFSNMSMAYGSRSSTTTNLSKYIYSGHIFDFVFCRTVTPLSGVRQI